MNLREFKRHLWGFEDQLDETGGILLKTHRYEL